MGEPALRHQTETVKSLIGDFRQGRIVIPEFQRDYVWKKSKAPKLLDSIYRGFPISSLLVWKSTDDVLSRKGITKNRHAPEVNWLIDGQQRITTLSRVFAGDEGIEVVFNPKQDEFSLANAATKNSRDWIAVWEIWDDKQYRSRRKSFDADGVTDKFESRLERVRRILDYEVPTVTMIDHDFGDAVNAFERINTLGVKLKREDIESAQIAAKHSGFIAKEVAPFLDRVGREGFNRLGIMHLFRACAFVASPDGRSRTPLHQLSRETVLEAWKKVTRATQKAIDLMKSQLGLQNMDILWSGALLVPIISLFATRDSREICAEEIVGWLALATLLHRYSGSSDTTIEQDLRACRNDDPIAALLKNLRQIRPHLRASFRDFDGSLSDRGALLAAWISCSHAGVLDFHGEQTVRLHRDVERHHILPRAQFSPEKRFRADNVANIGFICEGANKSLGQKSPEVYLPNISRHVLESQLVPMEKSLWKISRAEEFWKKRRQLLADAFNEFVRQRLPNRRL